VTLQKNYPNTRIIGLFTELLAVGGVQEAGRLTATALQAIAFQHGWSTNFLSLNDPPGLHSLDVGARSLSIRGFGRAKIKFTLSGIGRSRSAVKNSNCVVLAAHPNLAVPAAWMRRAAPQLKVIVMSHGIEVWRPMPAFRQKALAGADLVLAPSSDTARKLVSVQGVAPEKVRKLAWPISPSFLRAAGEPAGLLLPPAFPQGPVILTVGRWAASERYKGADDLIRSVAQLREMTPGLHLVTVGGGDDVPRLKQLAAELSVADHVSFLENLSREEIAACYAHADIFALPSTGEGFGLVFLEAMAFGKAVVGVAAGGATDVIEDGVNGLLIPPRDSAALARVLSRLLQDGALRSELGRRGAEIVRQKYQFGSFQAELERILADCGVRSEALA
jgi:glycosyltransferase involved in cell wall biosynthesis